MFTKRKNKNDRRISKTRLAVGFVILVITMTLAIMFSSGTIRNFEILLNSMVPTLHPYERVIVDARSSYKPAPGDVVAVINPREDTEWFCKRIVASPGDTVEFRDAQLFVNKKYRHVQGLDKQEYHRWDARMVINPYDFHLELAENEYYVVGDNIDVSYDSRYFGPVQRKDIIGKALFVYWPWEKRRKIESADYQN